MMQTIHMDDQMRLPWRFFARLTVVPPLSLRA